MPTPSYEEALLRCQAMIRTGSKSFSLAAKIFGEEERAAASLLYGWCRFCDDAIDEASRSSTKERLQAELTFLRTETLKAYDGKCTDHPVFVAFQHVVRRYRIPSHYPLELLEGMAMDIDRTRYATFEDLLLYCYRVAGTVGLMMSHVMGISRPVALQHANDMGMAMQLTNIARDVMDDAAMGRVYLPTKWLQEEKVEPSDIALPQNREAVARIVARLLQRADYYYQSGDAGLKYLAFRPACAVSAARSVYSEIGREVRSRGVRAWDERVWIRTPRKLWVMVQGAWRVIRTLPRRLSSGWNRAEIALIWRHA